MISTITRNREILKRVLLGDSYEACAQDYHFFSMASVPSSMRSAVDSLKEHTDIDIISTASLSYLKQHKEMIFKYLEEPYPKTDLLYNAKHLLKNHFGKYYARMPEKVAKEWDEFKKGINVYQHRRELDSIKAWLGAEGYLIDDYLTHEMIEFALNNLTKRIKDFEVTEGDYSFKVNEVVPHTIQGKPACLLRVEIGTGEHRVNKTIAFEMV